MSDENALIGTLKGAKRVLSSCYRDIRGAARKQIGIRTLRRQRSLPRESGPIRVVFLAQYIPSWNKLQPVYDALFENESFEVFLVCVPSDIEGGELKESWDGGNDTYEWYVSHGYDAINARQGGGWLDLRELSPDVVFHSRPYDHFMPRCYQAREVAEYAKLCSILYGLCFDKGSMPIVINDSYFDFVSCFFAECRSEAEFFASRHGRGIESGLQEVRLAGMPLVDRLHARAVAERQGASAGKTQRTVLWTPRWSTDPVVGGSHFLELKDSFLEFAEDHSDVDFIVRPHPLMFRNFAKTGEFTHKEESEFRASCYEAGNIAIDEGKEYIDALCDADLMISDMSAILIERYATSKPTILWPIESGDFTDEYNTMASTFTIVKSVDEVWSVAARFLDAENAAKAFSPVRFDLLFGEASGRSVSIIIDTLLQLCGR